MIFDFGKEVIDEGNQGFLSHTFLLKTRRKNAI
jgi:hypothetical protein